MIIEEIVQILLQKINKAKFKGYKIKYIVISEDVYFTILDNIEFKFDTDKVTLFGQKMKGLESSEKNIIDIVIEI